MKCFVCALDKAGIGIPAERTERIIPVTRAQTEVYETNYENETQTAYISLPALLRQKEPGVQHGLILKPAGGSPKTVPAPRIALLVPRVDMEMEIPEEETHSLPLALTGLNRYFSGACFTKESVILVLDTKKIMEAYCD